MLRSDHMAFCEMYLQAEAAFEILSQLGEIGCVQFLDAYPEAQLFQRTYVAEVARCAEMERKLRFMEIEMKKDKIYIPPLVHEPKAMQPNEMMVYENIFEKWETEISQMAENNVTILKNYLQLNEMYYTLSHVGPMLGSAEFRDSLFFKQSGEKGDIGLGGRLVFMSGVVRRSKSYNFEMMLWRVSRGNIYYRQASRDSILQDPYTRQEIRKVAFLAVCQGEQLANRMQKVFNGFGVNTYPCPQTEDERHVMILSLDMRLTDLEQVLQKTQYHRCKVLFTVGKQWRGWMTQVRKTKAIYHAMNQFNTDATKKCLIGQCWVPVLDLKRVQDILEYCTQVLETNVPSFMYKTGTQTIPPTYHRTNKFTSGFQAVISAYGHAAYRELNPGLYTIITYPFLFAIMFGDVGHGLIVFLVGAWMVIKEKEFMSKKSDSDLWNLFFGGRYVILLLGMFSFYTGFIYNDVFGKGVVWMHSYWLNSFSESDLSQSDHLELDPSGETKSPFVFGLDPVWELAANKIMMENSIKMKMAIIIGVVHMIFGLVLSLFNHIYFKRYHSIYLQFIPQFLFLTCIFLWLVILIYFKWFKYNPKSTLKLGSSCAPQILILFIDIFLFATSQPVNEDCDAYMFESQELLQRVLLIIAICCVPTLLFGTPIYTYIYNKKKRNEALKRRSPFRRYQHRESGTQDKISQEIEADILKYTVSFTELLITQGIHTVEFVLGTVSHTASYLRLWALSIAHALLTDMLWIMILSKLALRDHSLVGAFKIFVIFAIWATFTVAILVVMEGLSAFLHTLRLHWTYTSLAGSPYPRISIHDESCMKIRHWVTKVEFMSKFYEDDGVPFRPFCFQSILSQEDKPENVGRRSLKKTT